MRIHCAIVLTALVSLIAWSASNRVSAQSPISAALTGAVIGTGEEKLEGVLVTVRRRDANFTVTVVSDEAGRYAFPRSNVVPGTYAVQVRAAGYELDGTAVVDVRADKTASLDIHLKKAEELSTQLTSLEWITSMPGTPEQKKLLVRRPANCVFCHPFDRVVRSHYTAEQWIPVIDRMSTYNPDYTGLLRHQKNPRPASAPPASPEQAAAPISATTKALAEYLSTVNLSRSETWDYQLKTLPRPKGRGTHVIITQYDLPRRESSVHDIDVDARGHVWYGDSGWDKIGTLDPTTATFTEFDVPNGLSAPPAIQGVLDVQTDKANGLWAVTWGAQIGRFDAAAKRWNVYPMPEGTRLNFIAPFRKDTGTVWANAVRSVYRIHTGSGKVDMFANPFAGVPGSHAIYMVERDSHDNAYFMDFGGSAIGRIDAKTGEAKLFPTPTPDAFPRRGYMDAQDRLWFGEFFADEIGMFDTKNGQFQEFPVNRQYIAPYYARPDKNGDIWTSSQGSDRLLRLNPKTGEIVEYLMPSYYDARKVVVDASSNKVTVWLPNKNTGQLICVQPLN
jgi:streptogramin lyase